jgi:shikimate dehydrogenase
LIGHPIASSAAPAMHEAAARAHRLDARYHLIDLAGADDAALRLVLEGVRRIGFAGVNVTYPYKERVVALLDEVAPDAARLGAVNTVVVDEGRLLGWNTDMTGFRAVWRQAGAGIDQIAVIGAGGVGSAIAAALADPDGPTLRLFDSQPGKAARLAGRLAHPGVIAVEHLEEALDGAGAIVNASPVGMTPSYGMPIPASRVTAAHLVIDVVYTPLTTELLTTARAVGARAVDGRALAIEQALDAFRLFTGLEASRPAMTAAFDQTMATRTGADNEGGRG